MLTHFAVIFRQGAIPYRRLGHRSIVFRMQDVDRALERHFSHTHSGGEGLTWFLGGSPLGLISQYFAASLLFRTMFL